MPKRETAPVGAPCWVDLMTSDQAETAKFYGDVFGWTVDDPGPEYGGYKNFHLGGVPVAGCMGEAGEGGMPTNFWSVYLASDDAQKTVDAAAANGGQVLLAPMAVIALGTMAMVTDPGGDAVGIWQPGEHKGFGILAETNAPSWFELHTQNYAETVKFYEKVFGWDTHTMADGADFRYTTLGEGDGQLAGIMDASQHPEGAQSGWAIYFGTDSTDASVAKVEQLGGKTVEPAQDTPYGRLAVVTDSTGATFRLVQDS